jgi:predicted type IV restriction endonuclease
MNFDKLNEADVREEIIAPLVRQLGYRSDSENNVLRELPLRYPSVFFGRKSQKKDQLLRGKADYVLEAGRRVRWVIEAKSPAAGISDDDVEQAYSYAVHAEVRAVYFVLCNGREFIIFQTNMGPGVSPLLKLSYDQLVSAEGVRVLENLLSPK